MGIKLKLLRSRFLKRRWLAFRVFHFKGFWASCPILCLSLIASVVMPCAVKGQGVLPKNPGSSREEMESWFYEHVHNLVDARDALESRFAAGLIGESGTRTDKRLSMGFAAHFRAMDRSRDWDHGGYYSRGHGTEMGEEYLRVGDDWKIRDVPAFPFANYQEYDIGRHLGQVPVAARNNGFDPYDDIFLAPSGLLFNRAFDEFSDIERLLVGADLVDISRRDKGVIRVRLVDNRWEGSRQEFEFNFDPKIDYRPSHSSSKRIILNGKPSDFYNRTEVRWRKLSGHWVPVWWHGEWKNSMKHKDLHKFATFKIVWLIGKQLEDAYFESENPLAHLLDALEMPHSRMVDGVRLLADLNPPEDLGTYNGPE